MSGYTVLVKAEGCKQGPLGGWHYETGTGHKVYVSGPEECNKVGSKFLSSEDQEREKYEGLASAKSQKAEEAIAQKEELMQKTDELSRKIAQDGKGLGHRMWNAIKMSFTGSQQDPNIEGMRVAGSGKSPEEMPSAISASDIMERSDFDGTYAEAKKLAKTQNMQTYMEKSHLPVALHDEKRGHTAMVKTVVGAVESIIANAAIKAGQAVKKVSPSVGSELETYGKAGLQQTSSSGLSDAEKAMGASYVASYSYAFLAKPVYYGTGVKAVASMGAAAVGAGTTVGWAVGAAATLLLSLQVWKRAIKPMAKKIMEKAIGENLDPVAVDLVNGYIHMNELTPAARAEMSHHMTIKSLNAAGSLSKAYEESQRAPLQSHEIEFYTKMLKSVLPGVLVDVFDDLEKNGFSPKDQMLIQKMSRKMAEESDKKNT